MALSLVDELKLIYWLFGFAIVFGAIGAAAVLTLIRRDRKKD